MQRAPLFVFSAVVMSSLLACGNNALVCGEGSVERDGICVAEIDACMAGTRLVDGACVAACPPGQGWNGLGCVPGPACGLGTVTQGNACVPACGASEHWDGDACAPIPVCGAGTFFDPATGRCEVSTAACAPGTTLIDGLCTPELACGPGTSLQSGECVPGGLPDPEIWDLEQPNAPTEFDLPTVGDTVVLGGQVDAPFDVNGDGYDDGDWDSFTFTAAAGTWLRIEATGQDAALPAFWITTTDPDQASWVRWGVEPNGITASREVFLPRTDTYRIWVSDISHVLSYLFGSVTLPVGGDDFGYVVSVENLGAPTPIDVTTVPFVDEGEVDNGGLRFYRLSSLAAGELVGLFSDGLPAPGVQSDLYPALTVLDGGGEVRAARVVSRPDETADLLLVGPLQGDLLVVHDHLAALGPQRAFRFRVEELTATDCGVADCAAPDIAAGETGLYAFDLRAGDLLVQGTYLEPGYEVLKASLIGGDMRDLVDEHYVDFMYNGVGFTYAQAAQRVYLWLREVYAAPVDSLSIDARVFATPELTPGDHAGLPVFDFPPFTLHDAGVAHFSGQAGKMIFFNDLVTHGGGETWMQPAEQIANAAFAPLGPVIDTNAWNFPDGQITPTFAYAPDDGHYLYVLFDQVSEPTGGSYDISMFSYDADPLGNPAVGSPVRAGLQSLAGMGFYTVEARENQWLDITVTPTFLSSLQPEIWVFNFGQATFHWVTYYWLPDASAQQLGLVETATANAGGDSLSLGYNSPYDGLSLILVQDVDDRSTTLDRFDIEVAVRPPSANDSCFMAEPIVADASGQVRISGDSRGATDTVREGICDGYLLDAGPELFYRLDLDVGQLVELALEGEGFNAALYLFTDCADPVGSTIALSNAGDPEALSFEVMAAGPLFIGVDACGAGGAFTLDVTLVQ